MMKNTAFFDVLTLFVLSCAVGLLPLLGGCATADKAGSMMLEAVSNANKALEIAKDNRASLKTIGQKVNGIGNQFLLISSNEQARSESNRNMANNLFDLSTQITNLYQRKSRRISRLEDRLTLIEGKLLSMLEKK